MVKISVIMPAYNVADYIEKSVRSVMNQSLEEIELIIINDASTDNTWDVIATLAEEYGAKIKGINLMKNVRQGGARNCGIREAKGEYIAFVDSDDWIVPDALQRFYSEAKKTDADIVATCRYYRYISEDNIQEVVTTRDLCLALSEKGDLDLEREKLFLCPCSIWRNIFKRKIIVDNQIWFPEGVSYEDNYFYNLYLGYVKKYTCIDEAFYYYRLNLSSTLHRKDYTQLQRETVEKKLLQEYKERNLYLDVKEGFDCACIQRWYINTIGLYFARFGTEGVELSKKMSKEFREYFPHYRKNKYFKTIISRTDRIKLRIFELSPKSLYLLYKVKYKFSH